MQLVIMQRSLPSRRSSRRSSKADQSRPLTLRECLRRDPLLWQARLVAALRERSQLPSVNKSCSLSAISRPLALLRTFRSYHPLKGPLRFLTPQSTAHKETRQTRSRNCEAARSHLQQATACLLASSRATRLLQPPRKRPRSQPRPAPSASPRLLAACVREKAASQAKAQARFSPLPSPAQSSKSNTKL